MTKGRQTEREGDCMATFVVELRYTPEGPTVDQRRIGAHSFTAGDYNYVFYDEDDSVVAAMPTSLVRRCIKEGALEA